MKRILCGVLMALCLAQMSPAVTAAELIPGGQVIGLELRDGSVSVAAFDETLGSRAKTAGLQVGDRIVDIDGVAIRTAADVRTALEQSDGRVELTVFRDGQEQAVHMEPLITADGPRLGISLRQGVTGLGTVTWLDPETGDFGALGHGVSNGRGELVDMVEGYAYDASVISVKKGACGEPGQLRGGVEADTAAGVLKKNTQQGIFGRLNAPGKGTLIETATAEQIRPGKATILSTVSGAGVGEYSVEILKVYSNSKCEGRNLLLQITDPELLATTGGIVQGM
ncbi:MAG: PDZ domain-containing protein [Ruminococcaceae bacterium]|nr:PDZ domain-containing protein [Oscillospiraceae bacterium]